jgi:signal transduction histidine kinase
VETSGELSRQPHTRTDAPDDVEQLKAQLEDLRRAYSDARAEVESLRELDKIKDEFLSVAGHELKTPLAVLIGLSDMLLLYTDRVGAEERKDLLERMRKQAEVLNAMIGQLVDLSRSGVGEFDLNIERISLSQLMQEVCERLKPMLTSHDLKVEGGDDVKVLVDRDNFDRILGNLLTNAAKYSPQGSAIEITTEIVEAEAHISVADHGQGISPEDQERVFDRFFRVRGGRSSGSGMGLAVAARYVELQGGRIWVDSLPGEGSKFTFTLTLDNDAESAGQ